MIVATYNSLHDYEDGTAFMRDNTSKYESCWNLIMQVLSRKSAGNAEHSGPVTNLQCHDCLTLCLLYFDQSHPESSCSPALLYYSAWWIWLSEQWFHWQQHNHDLLQWTHTEKGGCVDKTTKGRKKMENEPGFQTFEKAWQRKEVEHNPTQWLDLNQNKPRLCRNLFYLDLSKSALALLLRRKWWQKLEHKL